MALIIERKLKLSLKHTWNQQLALKLIQELNFSFVGGLELGHDSSVVMKWSLKSSSKAIQFLVLNCLLPLWHFIITCHYVISLSTLHYYHISVFRNRCTCLLLSLGEGNSNINLTVTSISWPGQKKLKCHPSISNLPRNSWNRCTRSEEFPKETS